MSSKDSVGANEGEAEVVTSSAEIQSTNDNVVVSPPPLDVAIVNAVTSALEEPLPGVAPALGTSQSVLSTDAPPEDEGRKGEGGETVVPPSSPTPPSAPAPPVTPPPTNLSWTRGSGRRILVGICAREKKVKSKAMTEILSRFDSKKFEVRITCVTNRVLWTKVMII